VDHAATMRKTYELISAGDIAGFGDLVADDFVEHQGGPGFPEDLVADGDKTVARVVTTGTHQGDFMGIPPTGSSVEMQLIDIMRFDAAGRVCEHWGVADMLSLMQQLGVVPDGAPV
jgi:predicted ester cyclase